MVQVQLERRTDPGETKQSNKRTAEQMEAAHKTSLAKGEVGIRERKPVPTLENFMEREFLPFVRTTKAAKPYTVRFYENSVANLKPTRSWRAFPWIKSRRSISRGLLRTDKREGSGIQHRTVTLLLVRRVFHLAQEWGKVINDSSARPVASG